MQSGCVLVATSHAPLSDRAKGKLRQKLYPWLSQGHRPWLFLCENFELHEDARQASYRLLQVLIEPSFTSCRDPANRLMANLHDFHSVNDADEPASPSSTSTSDVFHDTASYSGRDPGDTLAPEQDSFFDVEDTAQEADTGEHTCQQHEAERATDPSPPREAQPAAESAEESAAGSSASHPGQPAPEPDIEKVPATEALVVPSPEVACSLS